jgi:glycosyltransferase involved in cell wall biosynthesis
MSARPIRLLYLMRDKFPAQRVDIQVLFARKLASRGHRIELVMASARSPQGFLARVVDQLRDFWRDLTILLRASRSEYDAVQVRDKFLIAAIAIWIARRRALKSFFWLSFPFPETDILRARERVARYRLLIHLRGRLTAWMLRRWILPRSDHIFAQSELMKRDMCAQGLDPAKVTAVPMGFELSEIQAAQRGPQWQDARLSSGEVRLGYLGVLDVERRLEILIELLADLRGRGTPARLLVVGDAEKREDREAFERHARHLGVADSIEITGFLPRGEALKRIRSVDVALSPIFPSAMFRVASPTKLVEYMALELPVVANDQFEQRQILRMSRAGVCVPWGARHFARAVRWLMQRSAAERDTIGRRGRAWAEAHRTYERIADQVESQYLTLLSSKSYDHIALDQQLLL